MTASDSNSPEASDLAQTDFTQYLADDAIGGLRVGLVVEDDVLTQAFEAAGVEVLSAVVLEVLFSSAMIKDILYETNIIC